MEQLEESQNRIQPLYGQPLIHFYTSFLLLTIFYIIVKILQNHSGSLFSKDILTLMYLFKVKICAKDLHVKASAYSWLPVQGLNTWTASLHFVIKTVSWILKLILYDRKQWNDLINEAPEGNHQHKICSRRLGDFFFVAIMPRTRCSTRSNRNIPYNKCYFDRFNLPYNRVYIMYM